MSDGNTTLEYLAPPVEEIRVMIADDHELIRSAVRQALRSADDIRVVAETATGESTVKALENHSVDVLLLDMRMPKGDGFEVLDCLQDRCLDVSVLILSVEERREVAVEALRRGAMGFIQKSIRPADLASAIRQAASGNVYMGGPALVGSLPPDPREKYELTDREVEILRLVADGRSNSDIAAQLHVTVKTVKYHLTNVFAKLGVANRTEAAALVHREHI